MSALARYWSFSAMPIAQLCQFYQHRLLAFKRSVMALAVLAVPLLVYLLIVPTLITRAYAGTILPLLSQRIQPSAHPLDYYQAQSRLFFSHMFLIAAAIELVTVVVLFRKDVIRLITRFFTATTSPINLAIFRIVLFAVLIRTVNIPRMVWLSQLPSDLRFAPSGLKPVLPYVPITPTTVTVAGAFFYVVCFMALLGLFTRFSTVMALVLGLYVLGVPQFFGKVNHYQHLIWFTALLAVSRCGDALSLDAIFAAWRRADRGITTPPAPARVYALPIRFAWLLFGVLYFFPGFWKFWSGGFDWAFSDNLKFRMYEKWMSLDGWQPFFAIDQYPLLYRGAALGTMLFELSFIAIIFFPHVRQLLAIGGILFHSMIYMFMNISFFTLVAMYVVFFDWAALFHKLGRRLFKDRMFVLYDGNCGICRRTIATLRAFDVFGRITYVNALDQQAVTQHNLHAFDQQALIDMHVVSGQRHWAGFAAYRVIAWRVPLLWLVLPLLYLQPVATLGQRMYRRVADSRVCRVPQVAMQPITARGRGAPLTMYAIVAVGSFLVAGNLFFGAMQLEAGWPLACYPRFNGLRGPTIDTLQVVALTPTGQTIPLSKDIIQSDFAPEQFIAVVKRLLRTNDQAVLAKRFRALWDVWVDEEPALQQATKVRFYKVNIALRPNQSQEPPLRSDFLMELDL